MSWRTVFWPSDAPSTRGVFYGWAGGSVVVVAGVVSGDVGLDAARRIVDGLSGFRDFAAKELLALCEGPPAVLGTQSTLRLTFLPEHQQNDVGERMILYRRPELSQMRFFAIDPLRLDITQREGHQPTTKKRSLSDDLLTMMDLDFTKPENTAPALDLHVRQMNAAFEIHRLVIPCSPSFENWFYGLSVQAVRSVQPAASAMSGPVLLVFHGLRWICGVPLLHGASAKDVSATLQQVDTRVEQGTILPPQLSVIQRRSRSDIAHSSAQYISFYNCVWLILNDIIIGSTLSLIILENAELLSTRAQLYSQMYTVDWIRETLLWLDDWPIGLKLNTQLSRLFCLLFIGLTDIWADVLLILGDHLILLVYVIGASGFMGSTMILSISADVLSLLTIHLYTGYLIATTIFSWQLSVVGSLWRLFRGKRWNVLRNRTDSWDYDLDQLILGTILFTLLAFLFPTVLVYYSLFAFTRLLIIIIHASLDTLLSFMNHFPLFAMMLRMKDPSRLPGGMFLEISEARIWLKNRPISFGDLFTQHLRVWSKLSAHYDPRRLLRCLVKGDFLTPIQRYKIRYQMLSTRDEPARAKEE